MVLFHIMKKQVLLVINYHASEGHLTLALLRSGVYNEYKNSPKLVKPYARYSSKYA